MKEEFEKYRRSEELNEYLIWVESDCNPSSLLLPKEHKLVKRVESTPIRMGVDQYREGGYEHFYFSKFSHVDIHFGGECAVDVQFTDELGNYINIFLPECLMKSLYNKYEEGLRNEVSGEVK